MHSSRHLSLFHPECTPGFLGSSSHGQCGALALRLDEHKGPLQGFLRARPPGPAHGGADSGPAGGLISAPGDVEAL